MVMDTQLKFIVIIYSATIVLCTILYVLFPIKIPPIMEHSFFRWPFHCETWSIAHFVLYALLGYFAPSYWPLLIVIGIIWEIMEHVGHILGKKLREHRRKHGYKTLFEDSLISYAKESYVGRLEDIIINTVGVIVGVLAHEWM